MSHKVHPYAHRLVVLRDWKSRWIARDKNYRDNLKADILIREFLLKRLRSFYVDSIEIQRGRDSLRITIKTSRPGLIIGRSGEGSVKLKEEIRKYFRKFKLKAPKEFHLDIQEVRSPESHAAVVAQMIAEGLEKRLSFRRVTKQVLDKIMANKDVLGARIRLAGRLDGGEMSRTEVIKSGPLPLQKLRADIDFAHTEARLPYGQIGVKVWIYRGDVFEDKLKIREKQK